jgi:hypothetical protein
MERRLAIRGESRIRINLATERAKKRRWRLFPFREAKKRRLITE